MESNKTFEIDQAILTYSQEEWFNHIKDLAERGRFLFDLPVDIAGTPVKKLFKCFEILHDVGGDKARARFLSAYFDFMKKQTENAIRTLRFVRSIPKAIDMVGMFDPTDVPESFANNADPLVFYEVSRILFGGAGAPDFGTQAEFYANNVDKFRVGFNNGIFAEPCFKFYILGEEPK